VALTRYGKLVAVCVYRPTPRLDLYLDGRGALFISCRISHVLERVTGLGPLYSLNSGDTVATGAAGRTHWGHTVYIEYLGKVPKTPLINNRLKDVAKSNYEDIERSIISSYTPLFKFFEDVCICTFCW